MNGRDHVLATSETAAMRADSVSAGYGGLPVLRDVDLEIRSGEVVALLGANGAGKTTTLHTLAGELRPLNGTVTFFGKPAKPGLAARARNGVGLVTEERSVFVGLTVAENLRVGRGSPEEALRLFPELEPHLKRRAGLLSGGQQQMLSLGRALAARPRVLLADELSLGLAPKMVVRLLQAVRTAADEGVAVLLVEQHVRKALEVADRAYAMRRGRIVLSGTAAELADNLDEIEETYLAGAKHG